MDAIFSFFIWNAPFIWRERKKKAIIYVCHFICFGFSLISPTICIDFSFATSCNPQSLFLDWIYTYNTKRRDTIKKNMRKKSKKALPLSRQNVNNILFIFCEPKKQYQVGRFHCVFISGWKYGLNRMERKGKKI